MDDNIKHVALTFALTILFINHHRLLLCHHEFGDKIWDTLHSEQNHIGREKLLQRQMYQGWKVVGMMVLESGHHPNTISLLHEKNYSSMNWLHSSALLSDDPATGLLPRSFMHYVSTITPFHNVSHSPLLEWVIVHHALGDDEERDSEILMRYGPPIGIERTKNHSNRGPQMNYAW